MEIVEEIGIDLPYIVAIPVCLSNLEDFDIECDLNQLPTHPCNNLLHQREIMYSFLGKDMIKKPEIKIRPVKPHVDRQSVMELEQIRKNSRADIIDLEKDDILCGKPTRRGTPCIRRRINCRYHNSHDEEICGRPTNRGTPCIHLRANCRYHDNSEKSHERIRKINRSVLINFEKASEEWRKNKVKIGQNMHYLCGKPTQRGTPCCRLRDCCRYHDNSEQ
uniref:Uncharacterized protein n=1 Tax=viral metagenome TaxID=1070528 RepID=A0A6C0CAS2_9ZZZZ